MEAPTVTELERMWALSRRTRDGDQLTSAEKTEWMRISATWRDFWCEQLGIDAGQLTEEQNELIIRLSYHVVKTYTTEIALRASNKEH